MSSRTRLPREAWAWPSCGYVLQVTGRYRQYVEFMVDLGDEWVTGVIDHPRQIPRRYRGARRLAEALIAEGR